MKLQRREPHLDHVGVAVLSMSAMRSRGHVGGGGRALAEPFARFVLAVAVASPLHHLIFRKAVRRDGRKCRDSAAGEE